MSDKMNLSDDEWKKKLTPECYSVCRGKGTEQPFRNKYWDCHKEGTYVCAACEQPLFSSKDKYDSGTGWPSFVAPISEEAVTRKIDRSLLPERVEILCSRCDSHLGHVFDDGPPPTGNRFCMNSAALKLKKS